MSDKAQTKFKKKVREITARNYRVRVEVMRERLNVYLRGWAGYYARFADGETLFENLDSWIRRRIRQWQWVGWKTATRRYKQLIKGGASKDSARGIMWCRSQWRASRSPALSICISNARIRAKGFVLLMDLRRRFATL